jgi:hypothetical protein
LWLVFGFWRFVLVFVPDSCGIGSWEADFFVVKTWTKRGSYVVVVVVSLVIFGSSLAGLGGRRFQGRREKTADLLHSFQVVEQQLESKGRQGRALNGPSLIFPALKRSITTPGTVTVLFVAGIPRNTPWCVPAHVERETTLSPAATVRR